MLESTTDTDGTVYILYTRKQLVRMAGHHARHSFDFRGDIHWREVKLAKLMFRKIPRSFRYMLRKTTQ